MRDKNDTFGNQDAEFSEGAAQCKTKLNLLCRADQLDTFIDTPAIAQTAPGEWKTSLLTALYFDTSDLDLRKSGFILHVRDDGRQYLMTLKSQQTRRNGPSAFARNEWAAPVSEMRPDVSMLIDILPPETVAAVQGSELNTLFRTEIKRTRRILAVPNGTVELAIDRGRIVAGKRVEEISELELELKTGQPRAIFELAQNLATLVPLRPSVHSKSDRGFELAFKKPPELRKAIHAPHDNNVSFGSLLDQTLRSIYQNMMESQAAAEDGRNPEGIHQFRIALRRLRSILKLIQPFTRSPQLVTFKDEAKWLLNQLNDVRDWDVFQTDTLPKVINDCNDVEGFGAIEAGARKLRMKAQERARQALRTQRVGKFQLALGLWIEQKGWRGDRVAVSNVFKQSGKKCARKILRVLNAKLLRHGRHIEKLSAAEQHQVRIELKKLHYAADFLLPLIHCGKDGRRFLRRIAQLQDLLGSLNDNVNIRKMLVQIVNGKYPHSAQAAMGAVIGWHAGSINTNSDKLQSTWKAFRKISSL